MKEEGLIRRSYSAHFDEENNHNHLYSLFHNCFHSSETIEWLIKKQLCKTVDDGQDIFHVLSKLKIIHHGKVRIRPSVFFLSSRWHRANVRGTTMFFLLPLLLRLRLDDETSVVVCRRTEDRARVEGIDGNKGLVCRDKGREATAVAI